MIQGVGLKTAQHRGHLTDLFGPLLLVEADVDTEDPLEDKGRGARKESDNERGAEEDSITVDGATSSSSVNIYR